MGKITLNNIRLYAYHGCLQEESLIGSDYRVDLTVEADLQKSALTDSLMDTVDYVHLQQIVKENMAQPSKLLEHVAQRIIQAVLKEIILVEGVEVTVSKINPPIGGDTESVSVTMSGRRV